MLTANENHAFNYADQYIGCIKCHESRHITSFCLLSGACFFCLGWEGKVTNDEDGTFVNCSCGEIHFWD
jgi:hypothetical protein